MRARRFLPRSRSNMAWLYLLERSDGIVKLGCTGKPHARYRQHQNFAKAQGTTVTRFHLLAAHPKREALVCERRALDALAVAATRVEKTEEFRGLPFVAALAVVRLTLQGT